jgi:hypothetical protein
MSSGIVRHSGKIALPVAEHDHRAPRVVWPLDALVGRQTRVEMLLWHDRQCDEKNEYAQADRAQDEITERP